MLTQEDRLYLIESIVEGMLSTGAKVSDAKSKLSTAKAVHSTSGIKKFIPTQHVAKLGHKVRSKMHSFAAKGKRSLDKSIS